MENQENRHALDRLARSRDALAAATEERVAAIRAARDLGVPWREIAGALAIGERSAWALLRTRDRRED
ncbi:hypothetical protein LG274_02590 [Micrococcus antarcticus]|uniref:hypothetical protein n=1 Tax=Micrococcus antarcticus TaxID=86171 RepID=UPI00384EC0CE